MQCRPLTFEQKDAQRKQCSAVYVFSAKGAAFNTAAQGSAPWTAAPKAFGAESAIHYRIASRGMALFRRSGMFWGWKPSARLRRAFSAWVYRTDRIPGAMPQARHEKAPLALE